MLPPTERIAAFARRFLLLVQSGAADAAVQTIAAEPRLVVTANDLLLDVVRRMQATGVVRCSVIDGVSRHRRLP